MLPRLRLNVSHLLTNGLGDGADLPRPSSPSCSGRSALLLVECERPARETRRIFCSPAIVLPDRLHQLHEDPRLRHRARPRRLVDVFLASTCGLFGLAWSALACSPTFIVICAHCGCLTESKEDTWRRAILVPTRSLSAAHQVSTWRMSAPIQPTPERRWSLVFTVVASTSWSGKMFCRRRDRECRGHITFIDSGCSSCRATRDTPQPHGVCLGRTLSHPSVRRVALGVLRIGESVSLMKPIRCPRWRPHTLGIYGTRRRFPH